MEIDKLISTETDEELLDFLEEYARNNPSKASEEVLTTQSQGGEWREFTLLDMIDDARKGTEDGKYWLEIWKESRLVYKAAVERMKNSNVN